ncbi:MAG: TonB-dependent receptor plug domain-containing protein [Sphingomonadaceae bacterium]|nr:TonB-dependent receptor plug domain-containing protein [Sphingomonadaceae bacterium]
MATLALLALPQAALANAPQATPEAPAEPADEQVQSYTAEDLAQFAPRTALDMLVRVPGFVISGGNDGSRGLGEATQNVLINGERLSSKSDSAANQLARIPTSDVVRIDIVDGTTLDIPGLSGQVANVITSRADGISGQFRWVTGFRPHNTEAQLYGGEISLSGSNGALDYSLSLSNPNDRFGADGPTLITAEDGTLIEAQRTKFSGKFDNPRLSANLTYRFTEKVLGHLNLRLGGDYFTRAIPETGQPVSGPLRTREFRYHEDGPEYEVGGDIEFPLGPGRMKLIGLERFERDNGTSILVDRFDDGSPARGNQFIQINETGERIGRFEYGWDMFKANWQLSGEAAFNRFNSASRLFELDGGGEFVELPFPQGTGGVTEDRYESILSVTKQLTGTLSLQASGGAEYSKIAQTGAAANARSFTRPKGAVSLAWKPDKDFSISVELRRKVGQLSFGDFLASVSLNNDNQNGGNNQLQPDQSWNLDFEVNKGLGAWGSAKLELRQAWFEDFVDFFPLPGGGEARGNIGDAKRTHLEANITLKLDPLGWKGAQVDAKATRRWMSVTDPFVGLKRPFSWDIDKELDVNFRHDIPRSSFAYGAGLYTNRTIAYSRRFEVGRDWEGPVFLRLFVEHKDLFGMTANASAGNVLGARNRFFRTVYDGERPDSGVLFVEDTNRRIGPIFRFTLSGNF